jgi:nucleoid-associated protein YgaU
MGRKARIGLFLLMGLVVALARLIEVEVGKAKPEEPPAQPALSVPKAPRPTPTPHAKKTHRGHHAPLPLPAAETPALSIPAPDIDAAPAKTGEPAGDEWPAGPVYTVKKGETLGVISQKVLGTSKLAQKLYEANAARIANPNFVKPGTKLIVPSREGSRGK